MKVIMINDCAFVGETLLKYLPEGVEKNHVLRSRKLFDKTLGLAYKILKSKGDIYHVHYLLQDCYIALKLKKKPLIGHAHGSDLRQQLNSKKWGWIVKHNLKKCDKILVAQPTILETAKRFNETSEYFPIPFDPKIFYPQPLKEENKKKTIFIASAHNFEIKGTDKFLKALAPIADLVMIKSIGYGKDYAKAIKLSEELGLKINFISKVPHEKMNKLYWESDLVLGSFGIKQLDTVAIEAMACGRPVVHSISKKFFSDCPLEELETIKDATETILKLISSREEREKRVKSQLLYVKLKHSAPVLTERLINIYSKIISK